MVWRTCGSFAQSPSWVSGEMRCSRDSISNWKSCLRKAFDRLLESLERDGVLPPRFAKSVVNLELIRNEQHTARLMESAVAWDLAIFDEAHHLRNTDTLSHALAEFMCERSKAAVFLTATPLQTHLNDMVHLMEALGSGCRCGPRLA